MKIFQIFILLIGLFACSPKTTVPAPAPNLPQPGTAIEDNANLSPCPNWLKLPNQDDISNSYFFYRDALKLNNYPKALEEWSKVYRAAPAADGKRSTVYDDGVKIYTHFYQQEKDPNKKKEYVDKVMTLYEQSNQCFPSGANVDAQIAFQYYYSFPGEKSDAELYALFKKAIDKDGIKTNYFVLNPFTALLIQQFLDSKIPLAEAQKYTRQVSAILDNGLKTCKNPKECEPWNIINEYVPARLTDLEGVEDYYSCDYYKNKYFKDFEAAPADCEVINTIYGRLRWAKCGDTDAGIIAVRAARDKNCRKPVVVTETTMSKAMDALNDGNYKSSIELLRQAVQETNDAGRKAELYMVISKIYYGNLRNFPESRKAALQAATFKPNWGEPYILVGKLYASSGPLCGPGRGYDSQQVVWPAVDKWNYAKSIDPSVSSEANKLINEYLQFMPTKEDIHMRSITDGSSIRIGCWIQENTKVRVIK